MGIYSFNHDTFGKTTNRAGAAGQNAAYNARDKAAQLGRQAGKSAARNAAYNGREEATYAIRSHVIPADAKAAEAWFHAQEKGERKNARMSDRFIAALPRELTPEQCLEAVEGFCCAITQDRIPWHFALHLELEKKGEPDWNPHTHIIFRDRDIETGKRFLYTSAGPRDRAVLAAKGVKAWSTSDFRVQWAEHMNRALARAGHEIRIDHRTLKEQGIDRTPQIHVGAGGRRAAAKGQKLESRDIETGRRTVHYSLFDDGTRAEHNARIMQANARREAAQALPHPQTGRDSHIQAAEAIASGETPAARANAPDHGFRQRLEHDITPTRDHPRAPIHSAPAHIRDEIVAGPRPSTPKTVRADCDFRPSPRGVIVEDYLALCRDPGRDLVAWANETIGSGKSRRPYATGEETRQGGLPPPRTPRTVADVIVEDYLALCGDPGRDLLGWVNETVEGDGAHSFAAGRDLAASPAPPRQLPDVPVARRAASDASPIAVRTRIDDSGAVCRNFPGDPGWFLKTWTRQTGNNAEAILKPGSDDARNRFRLRENALRPVQIRLEPGYGRRSGIYDLSSRPATRVPSHDAVHALQAGSGGSDDLEAAFPAGPVRRPGRGPPDETTGSRRPEENFDDGEQALRLLQLCFAELSRLVRRQLAHVMATAPRHQLDLRRRFIIEERDRHAAFLMKEFRENRANAMKRNREKARGTREPLRPQTTAPPGLMAAQREAQKPGREFIAAPS